MKIEKKTWGGKRDGAGRPEGKGKFGEKTKPLRIPLSKIKEVMHLIASKSYSLPLYSSQVPAGLPTIADDQIEEHLDLNSYLINNPDAKFLVKVAGLSMIGANIQHGDILIVDKSIEAIPGKIVVALVDGEVTVKRYFKDKKKIMLLPENSEFQPIIISATNTFTILGVVTSVIHIL